MNKSDVVVKVAESTGVSQKETEQVINSLFSTIKEELLKGEKVQFIGFGTFETSKRSAHEGRNPKTGEKIMVPEITTPKFTAGGAFKQAFK